ARDGWARVVLLSCPPVVLRLCTWWVLGVEIGFAPLALFRVTRAPAWWAAVLMHCGLLVLFSFWELSVGMLLFHLFVFDERWRVPLRHRYGCTSAAHSRAPCVLPKIAGSNCASTP